eukprot:4954462-Prymnesium_polylepis.4
MKRLAGVAKQSSKVTGLRRRIPCCQCERERCEQTAAKLSVAQHRQSTRDTPTFGRPALRRASIAIFVFLAASRLWKPRTTVSSQLSKPAVSLRRTKKKKPRCTERALIAWRCLR